MVVKTKGNLYQVFEVEKVCMEQTCERKVVVNINTSHLFNDSCALHRH